ncbi:MAG TPA: hypothetical protein VHZ76_10845, partial [Gammaproteobacteria bacterium]|nr:hypothetical protein [Gammaproteobacteria bacterium]
VQQALSNYLLLRVDLTMNNVADRALLKKFKVVAPPTILFFNVAGHELAAQRIVGEVSADEFLTRLPK